MAGASVAIRNVGKSFGPHSVLSRINLTIEPGEFLTLLGPSGCGKSTLLRMIAGFETPSEGSFEIDNRCVDGLRPKERGLSMVFQNYALYPHLTVFDNIAMPLVMRNLRFWERFPLLGRLIPGAGAKRSKIADHVRSVARTLEIDDLLGRKPGQLSGGQRQRVALGRAIAPEPGVFLMDEPLSNLDARLRIQMRGELTDLHRRLGITFVYVTHDQVEALTMSGRVAIIMDGELVQVGAPSDVYLRPADIRVARFIGTHPINVLPVGGPGGASALFGGTLSSREGLKGAHIAFRPEDASVQPGFFPRGPHLCAVVDSVEDHGGELLARVTPAGDTGVRLLVRLPSESRDEIAVGSSVQLCIAADKLHWFDAAGRRVGSPPSRSAGRPERVREAVT